VAFDGVLLFEYLEEVSGFEDVHTGQPILKGGYS
jgi:hypothetical protein